MNEIKSEDFHKMLLDIQNLVKYLNRNYIKDEKIDDEVIKMTKTLYDPEVEKKGIEKGKVELVIIKLSKKFNNISDYYKEKLMSLDQSTIDKIAIEIFDMETIEDLDKYINS